MVYNSIQWFLILNSKTGCHFWLLDEAALGFHRRTMLYSCDMSGVWNCGSNIFQQQKSFSGSSTGTHGIQVFRVRSSITESQLSEWWPCWHHFCLSWHPNKAVHCYIFQIVERHTEEWSSARAGICFRDSIAAGARQRGSWEECSTMTLKAIRSLSHDDQVQLSVIMNTSQK